MDANKLKEIMQLHKQAFRIGNLTIEESLKELEVFAARASGQNLTEAEIYEVAQLGRSRKTAMAAISILEKIDGQFVSDQIGHVASYRPSENESVLSILGKRKDSNATKWIGLIAASSRGKIPLLALDYLSTHQNDQVAIAITSIASRTKNDDTIRKALGLLNERNEKLPSECLRQLKFIALGHEKFVPIVLEILQKNPPDKEINLTIKETIGGLVNRNYKKPLDCLNVFSTISSETVKRVRLKDEFKMLVEKTLALPELVYQVEKAPEKLKDVLSRIAEKHPGTIPQKALNLVDQAINLAQTHAEMFPK